MNQINKIAIVGGTGKSGKYLVQVLLERNVPFKILLRNPESFTLKNPLIEIVKGDARNDDDIHLLVEGCDAVISTLGQPKGESSIFSQATKNIIRAMKTFGTTRYILTTGLNVDVPGDKKSVKSKMATDWMKTNYPATTSDKQVEFELLKESNTDWTLVRLPLIELTDERRPVQISLQDCLGDKIGAGDLAHFLYEQLFSNLYHQQAPFIANG